MSQNIILIWDFGGYFIEIGQSSDMSCLFIFFFSPDPGRESGLDKQNVMRLRINRIALIQELRVEHILRYLTESGILTEDDHRRIISGSTPGDKARVLVDILTGLYNLAFNGFIDKTITLLAQLFKKRVC